MPNKPNSSNLAAEFRFSDLSLISPEAPPSHPAGTARSTAAVGSGPAWWDLSPPGHGWHL